MKKTNHKTMPPKAAIVVRDWDRRDDSVTLTFVKKFAIRDKDVAKCLAAELSKPKSTIAYDLNAKLISDSRRCITSTFATITTVELVNPCEKLTVRGSWWREANDHLADFFGPADILKAEVSESGDPRPSRMEYAVITDADFSDGKTRMTPDDRITTFDDENAALNFFLNTTNTMSDNLRKTPGYSGICGPVLCMPLKRKPTRTFFHRTFIGKKQFVSAEMTKRQVWL